MKNFQSFKTNTGEIINVSANQSKRHFTIKTSIGKFRTYPMNQEEFDSNEMNTGNDWAQFLKSDDYFRVK